MPATAAWKKLSQINERDMTPAVARLFLSLNFGPKVDRRVQRLSAKSQRGELSPKEAAELFQWVEANDLLSLLRLRARRAMQRHEAAD